MTRVIGSLFVLGLVLGVAGRSLAETEQQGGFWCFEVDGTAGWTSSSCQRSKAQCEAERAPIADGHDGISKTVSECEHQVRAVAFFYYDAMRDARFEAIANNTRSCQRRRYLASKQSDVKVGPCKVITK